MSDINVFGVDISKHVFHIIGLDSHNKVVVKRKLKRTQILAWFAQHEPCQLSMEACASSHYWGRELEKLGYQVQLLPAQHVKAFVQGNKNDYNDALAIAEATNRPGIHSVSIKTITQQDLQAIQRMRKQAVTTRTALCNQTRGLLGEYGLIVPLGIHQLRKAIPAILEDAENELSDLFRILLRQRYDQLIQLDSDIEFYTHQLTAQATQNKCIKQLQTIPGFGPIVASAYHVYVGSGVTFANGRGVSASLGLVPKQHSTGGKQVLLGISKRGDKELRSLLVHGARSVASVAHKHNDQLSVWISRLIEQKGMNKATIALANKLARIAWVVTTQQVDYQTRPSTI